MGNKRKSIPNAIAQHGKATTSAPVDMSVVERKKKPKKIKKENTTSVEDSNKELNSSELGGEKVNDTKEEQVTEVKEESGDNVNDAKENDDNNEEVKQEAAEGGEEETSWVPQPIKLNNATFDIQFHPTADLLACSDVSGGYQYGQETTRLFKKRIHKESCRTICFSPDGKYLYSGSTDRSLKATDVLTGSVSYAVLDAHKEPINALAAHGNFVCCGDDAGVVKFWDTRQAKCVFEYSQLTDFVSDLQISDRSKVMATSADGQLSIFSLSTMRLQNKVDNLDDELLCLTDTGRYIVMGTQSGVLGSVKWGQYEELARMDNNSHTSSVDAILALDPSTVITGCSDGIIRVVKVVPSKVLHVVGNHDGFMIEQLSLSHDKSLLASVGHDEYIKFWDVNAVLNGPTVQEQARDVLKPDTPTVTTNIFTNIFNAAQTSDIPDYNAINYTINNTLTTTIPETAPPEDEETMRKKKPMKKGKINKLVKAKFFSDL